MLKLIDRFLLIFIYIYIYIRVKTLFFFFSQKIIIIGNHNQLWKQPHHSYALTLVLRIPRAKSRSLTASLRDLLLLVVAVSLTSLQTRC